MAYVFDERFSVVRTKPDLEAPFLRRLRVGHRIFVLAEAPNWQRKEFRHIVVSRNFSGWMLAAAVAAPGIDGDDVKLFRYAESQPHDKALIALRILTVHFERSPLRAAALLRLGQRAEEVAQQLSVRANRKLSLDELNLPENLDERDLFANYRGLDHFAAFGIRFSYQKEADRFVYSGEAYAEILKKYPRSREAPEARERLAAIQQAQKLQRDDTRATSR